MNSISHLNRRHNNAGRVSTSNERSRSLQVFPPERNTDLVRRRGGLITVPGKLTPPPAAENGGSTQKLTKLLLNVNIERSLGPVQVVTSTEKRVSDLIKAAVEIYVKEKRRPLLKESDYNSFQLHYSQYSLESAFSVNSLTLLAKTCLKADEKLINLGSRNFFLCSKPSSSSVNSSCSEEANLTITSPFPLTKLMDFLL
ncbi:hypothetical protein JRO89_XSUnG0172100 [Xanthoceras sorbifolium]|uniref:DUF7054 domain-containing protein n=1 Tax=Xanthoceras sorbifolium TaxID=99658 RepID=A0ABQ8GXK8_9ROSI|nr:hypothetical protein JRO89_XSUnG0172100 [Xanthoceras sorbifolium]